MDTVNLEDVVLVEENDLLMELLDKEISEETENMLACLKPMDREIFMEIYFREERPEKVGEKIGISKSAVYNHLSRGKKNTEIPYKDMRGGKGFNGSKDL